jgi:hypothetical protein
MIKLSQACEAAALAFYSTAAYLYSVGLERDTLETLKARGDVHPIVIDTYDSFGGRYKFLTILDMIVQLTFFSLCTVSSFLALTGLFTKAQTHLNKFLNYYWISVTFPVGCLVVVLFWSLYTVDRELIFPEMFDNIIPPFKNHIMHTLPAITAFGDNYLRERSYPKSFLVGFAPTLILGIAYTIW